jgi:hypothetical protein
MCIVQGIPASILDTEQRSNCSKKKKLSSQELGISRFISSLKFNTHYKKQSFSNNILHHGVSK